MKTIIAVGLIALFCLQAQAVTVEVLGKNGEWLYHSNTKYEIPSTVGNVTTEAFDCDSVLYEGGIGGISKLFGLGQDLDLISDSEMKAYGWCFSIDGVVADTMADKTIVPSQDAVIVWFYGYAHYKDGKWIGQCLRGSK